MSSSLSAVQTGVYASLTGDATLTALLLNGGGVRDSVPKDPRYPLVVIGDAVEVPDRHMGEAGHEVLFEIAIYTRDGSTNATTPRGGTTGFKTGLAILARINTLLVGDVTGVRDLSVTGFDLIDVDVDFSQTARESDGITRLIDTRYRLRLEA